MYALYRREQAGDGAIQYELIEKYIRLFGCKEGYIPWLLSVKLKPGQTEPFFWHVDALAELHAQADHRSCTMVIDLKPKQNKTNVSFYEVTDVWGVSDSGWTPILVRLRALFVDEDPNSIHRDNFTLDDTDVQEPIYEFLYLAGSVQNGDLVGTWAPPPVSPTNAALLWPDTLNYFFHRIQERDPGLLGPPDPAIVIRPVSGLVQAAG